MDAAKLNERRRLQKHRILKEARKILAKGGFDALSMRNLAFKLKLTPAALYSYFDGKEALVRELCDEMYLRLAEGQQRFLSIENPLKRLKVICLDYIRLAAKDPAAFKVLFLEPAVKDLDSQPRIKKGDPQEDPYAIFRNAVAAVIEERGRKPSSSELETMCQIIWAAGHGAASLSLSFAEDPWFDFRNPESLFEKSLELLLTGFHQGALRSQK